MAAELHPRSGKLVGLSNSNRTARRNQPVQEFNHGLVLSKEPLRDRDVFTVRIDKKVNKRGPAAAASPQRLQRTLSPGVRLPPSAVRSLCCPAGGGSHSVTAAAVCGSTSVCLLSEPSQGHGVLNTSRRVGAGLLKFAITRPC